MTPRAMSVQRTFIATALACTAVIGGIVPQAHADITIWDQPGEGEEPARYLDLMAVVQPGFIWRQNDEYNPVTDDTLVLSTARIGFNMKFVEYLYGEIELAATPTPSLLDGYVDARPFDWLQVRFGQMQMPFLYTYRFGAQNLAFNDRHIYVPGGDRPFLRYLNQRDLGLMVHGRIGDVDPSSTLPVGEYAFGAYLGRGPNQTRNDDDAFLYTGRLQLHALGVPEGYDTESDLARNETPRLTFGGAVYTNCDDRGQWNRGFTTDAEFRWQGLYVSGTFVWFKNGASSGLGNTLGYDGACTGVEGAGDHIASGGGAQVQYVLPQAWLGYQHSLELLARYDTVSPQAPCNTETGDCGVLGGDNTTPGYVAPPEYLDSDNAPTRHRITFGLNYFPTSRQPVAALAKLPTSPRDRGCLHGGGSDRRHQGRHLLGPGHRWPLGTSHGQSKHTQDRRHRRRADVRRRVGVLARDWL